MVSFSCEVCNDTVVKKKLDQHTGRCYGAYFTCIDCSTTFSGTDYRKHTSCISEAEKYEKALYKGPKAKAQKAQAEVAPKKVQEKKPEPKPETKSETKPETKSETKSKKSKSKKDSILSKYIDKEQNLYKIVKKAAKDNSQDIKDILKTLNIVKTEDGKYTIQ